MKRQAQEVYGFGARLQTRQNRAARLAALVLMVSTLGMLAGALWPF